MGAFAPILDMPAVFGSLSLPLRGVVRSPEPDPGLVPAMPRWRRPDASFTDLPRHRVLRGWSSGSLGDRLPSCENIVSQPEDNVKGFSQKSFFYFFQKSIDKTGALCYTLTIEGGDPDGIQSPRPAGRREAGHTGGRTKRPSHLRRG